MNTEVPGEYIITYTVTDSHGLAAAQITRTVVVNNNQPTLTLLGEPIVEILAGSDYTDAGAVAEDYEDNNAELTAAIAVDDSALQIDVPGEYVIMYNVTDSNGTAAEQISRTVIVQNNPPQIELNGENPIGLTEGDTYGEPGATASDYEDGDISAAIEITGSVDTTTRGEYEITYSITDSNNATAQTTRLVIIEPKPTDAESTKAQTAQLQTELEAISSSDRTASRLLRLATRNLEKSQNARYYESDGSLKANNGVRVFILHSVSLNSIDATIRYAERRGGLSDQQINELETIKTEILTMHKTLTEESIAEAKARTPKRRRERIVRRLISRAESYLRIAERTESRKANRAAVLYGISWRMAESVERYTD